MKKIGSALDTLFITFKTTSNRYGLPFWKVLLIATTPIFIFLLLSFLSLPICYDLHPIFWGEGKIVEITQFSLFFLAAVNSLVLSWRCTVLGEKRYIRIFYLVFALGMLFISGEEIAWGQQFLHFKTPEFLKAINTQNEFTFHNFGIFQDKSNFLNLIFGCLGMLGILIHVQGIMKKISVTTLFAPYISLILFLAAFGILFDHYLGERPLNYPSEYIFHIQTETAELLIALVGLLYPFVNRHIFFSPLQKYAVVDKIPNRKIPLLFPLPSYFARITLIVGVVCLVWLAIIPGDDDKAFLFGLSQIRLAMLTVGLCILIFIIYIISRSGRDQEWLNSISTRLNYIFMKSTVLWIFTVSGCMGLFACSIALIITYTHYDPYVTGILSRLAPCLVWTLILCLETIILTIPKLLPLSRSRLLQVGDRIAIEEM